LRDAEEPAPGQHFTTAGTRPLGRILAVEPKEHLTARIMGAVMSYVLVPTDDSTRLLLKVVVARRRWLAPLLPVGDLVMGSPATTQSQAARGAVALALARA